MLRELISIFRSSDPLGEMGKHFRDMLGIARDLTDLAGKLVFEEGRSPEQHKYIRKQDVEVNKLERMIRKQVVAHLSLSGTTLDLPYCILLISLVKDVERIGDYTKNLAEISDFYTRALPDDELVAELRQIRIGVESTFSGIDRILDQSDQEGSLNLIQEGTALAGRCDALVENVARSNYDAATAVAVVLATRYYKRIGGHLLNILSSVVMPLHKIDYYDEDSVPPELRTGEHGAAP